jgi:hypothetical protein
VDTVINNAFMITAHGGMPDDCVVDEIARQIFMLPGKEGP